MSQPLSCPKKIFLYLHNNIISVKQGALQQTSRAIKNMKPLMLKLILVGVRQNQIENLIQRIFFITINQSKLKIPSFLTSVILPSFQARLVSGILSYRSLSLNLETFLQSQNQQYLFYCLIQMYKHLNHLQSLKFQPMQTVTIVLLFLMYLVIQTDSVNMQPKALMKDQQILLAGKQFQIKQGDYSTSSATFHFNHNNLVWKQCNYYRCSFSQQGNNISITNCANSLILCSDSIESQLAKTILELSKVRIDKGVYIFSDSKGKDRLRFKQV